MPNIHRVLELKFYENYPDPEDTGRVRHYYKRVAIYGDVFTRHWQWGLVDADGDPIGNISGRFDDQLDAINDAQRHLKGEWSDPTVAKMNLIGNPNH